MAGAFTLALELAGPALYRAMGGDGAVLAAAALLLARGLRRRARLLAASTRWAASSAAPATWRCPPP